MTASSALDSARSRPVLGGWLATNSATSLNAFRVAGFDYVGIDMQHGASTLQDVRDLLGGLRENDFPVIVRVPGNDYVHIGKALDLGAAGVIVPMVDTREHAEAAVSACVFPPHGTRSYGPIRADLSGEVSDLNARGRCYVQIETATALRNAAEIAATPGLAGIYVGPGDLSISLGMDPMPGFTTAQLEREFKTLGTICRDTGIVFGAHAIDVESTQRWLDWGVQLISVTNDASLLLNGARVVAGALGISAGGVASSVY